MLSGIGATANVICNLKTLWSALRSQEAWLKQRSRPKARAADRLASGRVLQRRVWTVNRKRFTMPLCVERGEESHAVGKPDDKRIFALTDPTLNQRAMSELIQINGGSFCPCGGSARRASARETGRGRLASVRRCGPRTRAGNHHLFTRMTAVKSVDFVAPPARCYLLSERPGSGQDHLAQHDLRDTASQCSHGECQRHSSSTTAAG